MKGKEDWGLGFVLYLWSAASEITRSEAAFLSMCPLNFAGFDSKLKGVT